jgi:hypothetical protein
MPNFARSTSRGLLCLAALAALACADSTAAGPNASLINDPSASTVSIMNDGTVPLTNVKVTTSETDVLSVVATINPGQTVGPFPVSAMHTDPMVQATVQGRTIILHPVEGFSGFNPPRAAGAYVIRLRPGSEPNTLDLRVTPPAP